MRDKGRPKPPPHRDVLRETLRSLEALIEEVDAVKPAAVMPGPPPPGTDPSPDPPGGDPPMTDDPHRAPAPPEAPAPDQPIHDHMDPPAAPPPAEAAPEASAGMDAPAGEAPPEAAQAPPAPAETPAPGATLDWVTTEVMGGGGEPPGAVDPLDDVPILEEVAIIPQEGGRRRKPETPAPSPDAAPEFPDERFLGQIMDHINARLDAETGRTLDPDTGRELREQLAKILGRWAGGPPAR